MKQTDIDGLEASGLNPIVIDEHFDFSQLGAVLSSRPARNYKDAEHLLGKLFCLLEELADYAEQATLEGDHLPGCVRIARKMIAEEYPEEDE